MPYNTNQSTNESTKQPISIILDRSVCPVHGIPIVLAAPSQSRIGNHGKEVVLHTNTEH